MDEDDDYVETSDIEELEESRAARCNARLRARSERPSSPRKRLKTFHQYSEPQSPDTDTVSELFGSNPSPRSTPITLPSNGGEHDEELPDMSQDPLLLFEEKPDPMESSMPSDPRCTSVGPTTRDNLPTTVDSPFDEPLPSPPFIPLLSQPLIPDQNTAIQDHQIDDDLLHFDDLSPQPAPSPLSSPPPSERAISPPPASPLRRSPSLRLSTPLTESDPIAQQREIQDAQLARSLEDPPARRPLRQRNPQQLNPYLWDRANYKRSLQGHPDAIVPAEAERRRHHSGEGYEEESQEQDYAPPSGSDDEEDRGRARSRVLSDREEPGPAAALLPSPPESSEDEDMRGIRAESAALRRAQKEQRKLQKGKKKTKSFPVKEHDSHQSSRRRSAQRNATPGPSHQSPRRRSEQRNATSGPSDRGQSDETPATPLVRTFSPSSPKSTHDRLPDFSFDYSREPSPSPGPHPPILSRLHTANRNNESDEVQEVEATQSSESDEPEDPREKILKRMYPRFMWPALGVGGPRAVKPRAGDKRSSVPVASDDDSDQQAPRPGLARVRTASQPRSVFDIKGDSESEAEEDSGARPLPPSSPPLGAGSLFALDDHPAQPLSPQLAHPSTREVIEISSDTDSDLGSSDSDDQVDDQDIESYLNSAEPTDHTRRVGAGNEQLIDYMLARSVTVGGKGKRKRKRGEHIEGRNQKENRAERRNKPNEYERRRSSTGKSRYSYEVVRPGQGAGHQTLLSFQNHRQKGDARPRKRLRSGFSQHDDDSNDDESDDDVRGPQPLPKDDKGKMSWKEKSKQRKKQEQSRGVYTFTTNDTRIVTSLESRNVTASGQRTKKRRRHRLRIDDHDSDFHRALAPSRQTPSDTPRRSALAEDVSSNSLRRPFSSVSYEDTLPNEEPAKSTSRRISPDLDTSLLSVGKSFGSGTCFRRGLLHELLRPASRLPELVRSYRMDDLEIGAGKTVSEFIEAFPLLCTRLADFATLLPNAEDASLSKQWKVMIDGSCQVLSVYLSRTTEEHTIRLRTTVCDAVANLVGRMRSAALPKSLIDMITLDICWFAVESTLRSGLHRSTNAQPEPLLLEACDLLVHYLLEFGMQDVMDLLHSDRSLDDFTSLPQRCAELWVCLIHVLKHRSPTTQANSIWDIVQKDLKLRSEAGWTMQTNEMIWHSITSLCALSQFSENGLCTKDPSLPGSWIIVGFALNQIRMKVDTDTERGLQPESLYKRDRYIAVIVSRCFLLVSRWQWKLDSAWPVFRVLSETFQSRKYKDLRHESADFPEFLRAQRWESCYLLSRRDSAFTVFLKLIVQAGNAIKQSDLAEGVKDGKLKKLLTLITPIGSVSFTESNPPRGNDLSMLYNRSAATAVGLHLLPSTHNSRVEQARRYVTFRTSDDTSRVACIRGLMHLSEMSVLEGLALNKEIKCWYQEIIDSLVDEYKETNATAERRRNRQIFLAALVLGSLRRTLSAYTDDRADVRYPDPSVLDLLARFPNEMVSKSSQELASVLRTFLTARAAVVPAPELPGLAPLTDGVRDQESQESQDDEYGGLGIDLNDPGLGSILRGDATGLPIDVQSKDEQAAKALNRLKWPLYRSILARLEPFHAQSSPKPPSRLMNEIDSWFDTWIGTMSVGAGEKSWDSLCLGKRDESWGRIADIQWRRRIDITVFYKILSWNPTSYLDMKDSYIKMMIDALVPAEVSVEHDFISLLLSIDGLHHPLLRGLPVALPPRPELYSMTVAEFCTLRKPLLRGILENIERSLREGETDQTLAVLNDSYVALLGRFLSTLKDIWKTKVRVAEPSGRAYELQCKELVKMILEDHRRIGSLQRFSYWDVWVKGLD